MRISIAGLIVLAAVATGAAAPAEQDHAAVRVRIAVPERGMVAVRDKHSHFDVVIEDVSDKPVKIIDEWNSWGYFDLSLEFTLPNGEKKIMKKLDRGWDKNFLTTTTLKPGEVTVWEVNMDDAVWSDAPLPKEKGHEAKVTIRATFGQKSDVAEVWHGEVSSPEQEITFWNAE